jgi:hypothetical protein
MRQYESEPEITGVLKKVLRMTEYFDSDFEKCSIADAPTDRNDNTIGLIERMVDAGRTFPRSLGNSIYHYADDYHRHKHGAPLRKRAAGQYYLDDDCYPTERTLPYECYPLVRCDGGYRVTLVDEPNTVGRSRRRS